MTLNGSMNNDRLVWNGHGLNHGDLYHVDAEGNYHFFDSVFGYLGAHGEVYRLVELDPAKVGDLVITLPDASKIVVHDWSQGKLGITLDGGVMPTYGVKEFELRGDYPYPFSNLRDDGTLQIDDWDLITGGPEALATPGGISPPPPPMAFAPPTTATVILDHEQAAWREFVFAPPYPHTQIA